MSEDQRPNESKMSDAETDGVLISTRRAALTLLGSVGSVGIFSSQMSAKTENTEITSQAVEQTEEPDLPIGTEAFIELLEAKYGEMLTEENLNELRDDVAGNIRAAQEVDKVELQNSTGPAFTFQAYRGDE